MLVQDIMQSDVVTVTPRTTLSEAIELTRRRGIRHLPVLERDELVGIVSDRDLKRAMAPSAAGRDHATADGPTMGEIMTRPVITTGAAFPVEEAARMMATQKISALPVTQAGRVVGIVTETDLMQLFVRALGAGEPSSRLDVSLGRDRTALADVVATLEGAGAPISSVMTLVAPDGTREVIVRIATIDPTAAARALGGKGYTIRGPWQGAPRV
jgi:acetoin utilization protein AcuB